MRQALHPIQTETIDVFPLQKKERESVRIWEKNMAEENERLLCEYENMERKSEKMKSVSKWKKKKQNMEENEQRTK